MNRWILAGFLVLQAAPAAAHVTVASLAATPSQPVALHDAGEGRIEVVYTAFSLLPSAIVWELWQTQSADEGASWSAPTRIEPAIAPHIVAVQRMSANLVRSAGETLLVYQWYTSAETGLWLARSASGLQFPSASPIALGWSMVAERDARVVAVGGQRLAMLYRRPIAEGDLPAGLYFAGSTDAGVAWDHARTLVAADALGLDRPAFAVRAADDRHLAAYTVDSGAGSRILLVRTTLDATDWSAAPLAVSAAGDHLDPDLSVLADGSFLLVWARGDGAGGHDLVARRSSDGSTWSPEITLVEGNGALLGSPFALGRGSPGVVDLYWSRITSTDPLAPAGVIEHDSVVVLDAVFADGFD